MEVAVLNLEQFNVNIRDCGLWKYIDFHDTSNFDVTKSKVEKLLERIGITYAWNITNLKAGMMVTLSIMELN